LAIWLTILVGMMPIEVIHLARPVTTERIEPETNALQSAGRAVLRTLYSRARRIWLDEASWLLRGLRKNVSSDLLLVDVVRVFAQPALEVVVPHEQELERFTDDEFAPMNPAYLSRWCLTSSSKRT